jgi:ABC-type multidrug transport system ATPase subunit
MSVLQLEKVNKHYGEKQALKDFCFTFSNGIYGLLGPNGAGKSTLMNIITQNISADKGAKVTWDGEDIYKLDADYRSQIGFMPQQQELYPSFSAARFIGYIASLKGIPAAELRGEVARVLKLAELIDVADKKIGGFSGGMKQRLLIAQAVLGEPKLLIFDEPTAGLDPKQRVIFRKLVASLAKDKIVIISTHITSDIETIADMVLMIKEGETIDSGSIPELVEKVNSDDKNLENLYMQYYGDNE